MSCCRDVGTALREALAGPEEQLFSQGPDPRLPLSCAGPEPRVNPERTPTLPRVLTLTAWGALAAALMLVELNEASDGLHNVCLGRQGAVSLGSPGSTPSRLQGHSGHLLRPLGHLHRPHAGHSPPEQPCSPPLPPHCLSGMGTQEPVKVLAEAQGGY